ncbi:MBL fold metallo-hydrolase [Candidatus Magnetobacterium casense]|uniref:MBL fold metallo-hydrolase n=1 Tax=Candidatus Magnetobacterium casense TaxID=1455061 RepID=A0ABS6RUT8_9BACT|nr:MBL fold metallo-hydrolase [Candidatus Magnetobacterium casensis]MBV6340396.1 MBL fold metallo-hydrolase [Candidatus Magnetobacterium casensis]
MGIEVKRIVVGSLEVNCYLLIDEQSREAVVIDPGDEPDRILSFVEEGIGGSGGSGGSSIALKRIVCTHTHFDHIGAVPELKEATKAELIFHAAETTTYESSRDMAAFWGFSIDHLPRPDRYVAEGDVIKLGDIPLEVMHTPGHTPGSICLYIKGLLISGDTLFSGSVGRTDLPGGSLTDLKSSFRRLMKLPPLTQVLPGHGPHSTIADELKYNFFKDQL